MTINEILLLFFALPIAVIIISIALQKILRNPILVAAIIFAIFLIVTFVIGNLQFLVAAIVYAILSYITALLTCIICRCLRSQMCRCSCFNNCRRCNNDNSNETLTVNDISNSAQNNNILAINDVSAVNQNNGCGCNNDNNQVIGVNGVSARINVIPNNNGTTGSITGCYRRR